LSTIATNSQSLADENHNSNSNIKRNISTRSDAASPQQPTFNRHQQEMYFILASYLVLKRHSYWHHCNIGRNIGCAVKAHSAFDDSVRKNHPNKKKGGKKEGKKNENSNQIEK